MGFYGYGNRSDVQKNTSFVFDKIYPNRKAMDEGMADDGVYVGRHVLIEYDIEASSLDYKKAFYNKDAALVQGYNILYFSADLSNVTKILYDGKNNVIENNIIYTTTYGTIVYIVEDNLNKYYKCIGYTSLNPEDDSQIIVEINGTTKTYTSTLVDQFEADVKYALFQEIEGLVDTDAANNYAKNYNIDVAYAKTLGVQMSGHGWDSTVWEKTIVQDVEKYVMIAELNTVVPTFAISADAPTQTPLTPHFDTASTDVYYNLHWQPQWGMRVQAANAAESEGSAIVEPNTGNILSDDTTTWIKTTYDKSSGRTIMYYYTNNGTWKQVSNIANIGADGKLPAAIYYNKAGFSATQRYRSSLKDELGVKPTGISGCEYNTHVSGKTATAADIQEVSMVLPSIGNAISDMWDIIYGSGDGQDNSKSARWTDIEWLESPVYGYGRQRLQLVTTDDGKVYSYTKNKVETLAGSINSVHDLMGMIIIEETDYIDNLDGYAINKASADSIYFLNNKFYRKAPVKQYIELTDGEYIFTPTSGLDEDTYNTYTYYVKNEEGGYIPSTEAFDETVEYFVKEVEGKMTEVELTTFEAIMTEKGVSYLYRNGNYDYIYDTQYAADRQYFTIDATKVDYIGPMDDSWQSGQYYYYLDETNDKKDNGNYYLDTSENSPLYSKEYAIEPLAKLARKIYRPGDWYSVALDERGNNVYSLDLKGYNASKKYFYVTQLTSLQEAAEAGKLVYRQKAAIQIERTIEGSDRLIFYYTPDDNETIQYEVWYNSGTGEYITTDKSEVVDLDKGSVRPAYKYVIDSPVKYIEYKGDKTNITVDGTTGYPIFYTLNPYNAEYQSSNELYAVTEVSAMYTEVTADKYYKLDENGNYIRVTSNDDVPSYFSEDNTYFYTLEVEEISNYPLYQNNLYYYLGADKKSWYFDKNGVYDSEKLYYSIPDEAINEVDVAAILENYDIYEKGKYYYLINNRYMVDNALEKTEGRVYYKGQDDYVVYSDTKGILVIGSHWNTGLPIPHFITLGRKGDDTYRMEELVGFARTLNTIHGLILQINNFLEYGNESTRDTSTVQGTLNKLNDIIAKFNLIDFAQVAVTDAYGRLHTAPFATDEWLKAYVDPDVENPTVYLKHLYNPVDETTEAVDMNTNAEDRLILEELIPDDTGHIVSKNTKTVTLPSGIKKISADSGSYTAGTTQAAFEIKSADEWLSTSIEGNVLEIAHDEAQSAVNTKGLLSDSNPTFGSSFVVPKIAIDNRGHVQALEEYTLTLPKGSLTNGIGNVVTGLTFTPETGALVEIKDSAGNLVLGVYDSTSSGSILAEDSIAVAIAKTNTTLQTTKTELENSISALDIKNTTEHNTLQSNIDRVTNDLSSLISSNNQEHVALQSDIDVVANDLSNLINSNNQEHNTLQSNIDTLANNSTELQRDIEELQSQNNEQAEKISALQEANKTLEQIIVDLTERIEALEPVPIIEFTINDTSYQAEEGMTWAEWCDSSYNTDSFQVVETMNESLIYDSDAHYKVVDSQVKAIVSTAVIIEGYHYRTSDQASA